LTPSGTKRHQFSFNAFTSGKRICIGKTFAEVITKAIIPIIVSQVEFRFCNPLYYTKRPIMAVMSEESNILVKMNIIG
jgi:cytochrome P450